MPVHSYIQMRVLFSMQKIEISTEYCFNYQLLLNFEFATTKRSPVAGLVDTRFVEVVGSNLAVVMPVFICFYFNTRYKL